MNKETILEKIMTLKQEVLSNGKTYGLKQDLDPESLAEVLADIYKKIDGIGVTPEIMQGRQSHP